MPEPFLTNLFVSPMLQWETGEDALCAALLEDAKAARPGARDLGAEYAELTCLDPGNPINAAVLDLLHRAISRFLDLNAGKAVEVPPYQVAGVARILKTRTSAFQIFAMGQDGSSECVCVVPSEPSYEFLEKEVFIKEEYSLLRRRNGAEAGGSLEARLESSAAAAAADGGTATDWTIASTAEINAAVRADAIGPADVDAFSKTGIRTALAALGLPTSGKVESMRKRLREALLEKKGTEWEY